MSALQIKRATRLSKKVRIALIGISGSGKTYTALAIAQGLGERILVVDTEHGSASAYAQFGFDVIELESFAPQTYVDAIKLAEQEGYDVVILDSLSHAWTGKDGAIEQVDRAQRRSQSGNSFTAWKDVTPQHNAMIEAIVSSRCHIIATMRAKTEYVVEAGKNGKSAPKKVGLAPIQRDGMEYEFDFVAQLDQEHFMSVTKSRIAELDGAVIEKPGANVAKVISDWISGGAPELATPRPPVVQEPEPVAVDPRPALVEEYNTLVLKLAQDNQPANFPPVNAKMREEVLRNGLKKVKAAWDTHAQEIAEEIGEAGWSDETPTDTAPPPPAPKHPIAAATVAKAHANPDLEGEAAFEQSEEERAQLAPKVSESDLHTPDQESAIQTLAGRAFGKDARDERLRELFQKKYGDDVNLDNSTKKQAANVQEILRFCCGAVMADQPFEAIDAPQEMIDAVNVYLKERKHVSIVSLHQISDLPLLKAMTNAVKQNALTWAPVEGVVTDGT